MSPKPKIAIIGAGIAGVRLAQSLAPSAEVEIFDKSRGLGGRMSTRRTPAHAFDHGAQYFTAHGDAFRAFLSPYLVSGRVVPWYPRVVEIDGQAQKDVVWTAPRLVPVPGMTELCKMAAENCTVHRAHRVAELVHNSGQWQVICENGSRFGGYEWVFSTAPSVQSALLMPDLTDWSRIRMKGCYSLMLGFEDDVNLPFDAAVVRDNPLAWIVDNSRKPGRSGQTAILCQSSNDWAERHMEDDQDEVRAALCAAFGEITGIDPNKAVYIAHHRWRYAKVTEPAEAPFLLDAKRKLGAAGDWCGEGRIEAAFNSANALAAAALQAMKPEVV